MFKCKIDFNAFNIHNEKVQLALPKVKALSKAAVKKLLAKPGEKAPFFLILNYFKDANDKPTGDFLCFGIHKQLTKHFLTVEMKPGKPNKRMSANPKEAGMGDSYVKDDNGKKVLCFEPDPACKIPSGKWPKILKALKPMLGGMKAVLVLNGQVIEEDTNTGEGQTVASSEGGGNDPETEPTQSTDNSTAPDVANIKAMVADITKALKETLPKEIVPKIKSKTVEENDKKITEQVLEQFDAFTALSDSSSQGVQNKLKKVYDVVQKQRDKVVKIIDTIERLLGATTTETTEEVFTEEMDDELKAFLEELNKDLKRVDSNKDQWQKDLEAASAAPIAGGEDFLNNL